MMGSNVSSTSNRFFGVNCMVRCAIRNYFAPFRWTRSSEPWCGKVAQTLTPPFCMTGRSTSARGGRSRPVGAQPTSPLPPDPDIFSFQRLSFQLFSILARERFHRHSRRPRQRNIACPLRPPNGLLAFTLRWVGRRSKLHFVIKAPTKHKSQSGPVAPAKRKFPAPALFWRRASHVDLDRAGDFILKNLGLMREQATVRGDSR